MYDERIEQLISAALADGVLTEKEKQVLFKKAHAEGIDLDEFEIILDARLLEAQEAEKKKREKAAPKSDKYADVKKCPACGSIIPPNTKVCPGCGMVFSNNQEDIKEIAMLQDNYVKICNEQAKFPLGFIYISALILITLFNVFAWVFAIACDYLTGLPVLSTFIWIVAIIVFFVKKDKTYSAFSKSYDTAIAEHTKLYSTAKAFYAQDKNTLNRINDIVSQTDKVITEKNKTKITYDAISWGVLGLTIVLSLILSFGWFKNVLIRNNYSSCAVAIEKAINENDLEQAETYYLEYHDWGKDNLARMIMFAYIKLDEEAKVIDFYSKARRGGYSVNENGAIVAAIVNYYVSKDQYQSAIDVLSKYSNWEINRGLELCIKDYMKDGKKAEAQKLIKTNSHLFNGNDSDSEYYKPKVVKKLTELTRE